MKTPLKINGEELSYRETKEKVYVSRGSRSTTIEKEPGENAILVLMSHVIDIIRALFP